MHFSQGTVLHETLHTLTGLDESDLEKFVGPALHPVYNNITSRLQEAGCVAK